MRSPSAVVLALTATVAMTGEGARAATAYVTDELVLGVYAEQNTQGQRLTTLHSGASVETLAVSGDSTQVRLPDGITGWVKSTYLTNLEPARTRLKQLQEEAQRTHATTPELAEAAERREVERLTGELALLRAQASATTAPVLGAPPVLGAAPASGVSTVGTRGRRSAAARVLPWAGGSVAGLGVGFWLGYSAMARRMRDKFGGIKVYSI